MGVRNPQPRRKKPRAPPAPGAAAVLLRSDKRRQPQEMEDAGDLPSREALSARLESQRLELLRAMASIHLARRTIGEHSAEPSHGDVLPFRAEQHEVYRQRMVEALTVAGDALATAYPMLEPRRPQTIRVLRPFASPEVVPFPSRRGDHL